MDETMPQDTPPHISLGKSSDAEDLITLRRYRLVCGVAPPRGGVLLDFGCGNGGQTFLFSPHFSLTLGVDVSDHYLDVFTHEAARHELGGRTLALRYDGHRLPLKDGGVDYAISFEVLEHVASEHDALSELHRVIRPGGVLAMSVPNRWWVFETHGAALPLLPWNRIPFFIYERHEIAAKIEEHGFKVRQSMYVTAPMDVVTWAPLQTALRKTIFRGDTTVVPFLSTAVLVVARRE
jgi:SAM-dependent methyltransferase